MLADDFMQLRQRILAWRGSRAAFAEELARETRNRRRKVLELLRLTAADLAAGRRAWCGELWSRRGDRKSGGAAVQRIQKEEKKWP